jgi:sigma-B regulation protein RsbU (phosphoserine phosphatase)
MRSPEAWLKKSFGEVGLSTGRLLVTSAFHRASVPWYRIRIKLPPDRPVAIAPGRVADNYQVFADGSDIGHWGSTAQGSIPLSTHNQWSLLAKVPRHSAELVVALRVLHWPTWSLYSDGGFRGDPVQIGNPDALADWMELEKTSRASIGSPETFTAMLSILAGLFMLLLYVKERSSAEYLWFGLIEICTGLNVVWRFALTYWVTVDINIREATGTYLRIGSLMAAILFFFRFVGRPVTRWIRWFLFAQIVFVLYVPVSVLLDFSIERRVAALTLNLVIAYLTEIWLVFTYCKESRAARRLAFPLLLVAVVNLTGSINFFLIAAGWSTSLQRFMSTGNSWELRYTYLTQLCFLAAMAYVLIERFAETQAERTRLTNEFEAARTVQHVLIPDFLPPVAGITVESVYLPAQQVGGDFFQVLPIPGGGDAFIVVGDVSGKGLKAAMTVSLIVGTLRTLAEYVTTPAELLAGLNRLLHGRGDGFVTCLVLKITTAGDVGLGNAGHPKPYLDGMEIATENNLPLGLTLDIEYAETHLHLAPTQSLTLVTDGVVEATDPATRELFGFDRTQAISTQAAQAIAEAALLFGHGAPQADDITVLTVARA